MPTREDAKKADRTVLTTEEIREAVSEIISETESRMRELILEHERRSQTKEH